MWLKDSSIGRKFVMSISGLALVLFLLFHGCMNVALVFSEEAYNMICHLLGANWYAVVGTLGLAFLVAVHFCYALYLTIQNRAARGNNRYAVTGKKEGVEWASENMLVLGFCVLGFLCLHLYNFWFRMQFAELTGLETGAFDPQNGAAYVKALFTFARHLKVKAEKVILKDHACSGLESAEFTGKVYPFIYPGWEGEEPNTDFFSGTAPEGAFISLK